MTKVETIEDLEKIAGAELNQVQKSKKKKKKEGKHSTGAKPREFAFFNKCDTKYLRRRVVKELNVFARKYKVKTIDLKKDSNYEWKLYSPTSCWCRSFFIKYLEYAEQCKGAGDFERIWLDHLIHQCGIMVHNLVLYTYRDEFKVTGVVPESPLGKRKGGNSIEAVSEHFANEAEQEFRKKFE